MSLSTATDTTNQKVLPKLVCWAWPHQNMFIAKLCSVQFDLLTFVLSPSPLCYMSPPLSLPLAQLSFFELRTNCEKNLINKKTISWKKATRKLCAERRTLVFSLCRRCISLERNRGLKWTVVYNLSLSSSPLKQSDFWVSRFPNEEQQH